MSCLSRAATSESQPGCGSLRSEWRPGLHYWCTEVRAGCQLRRVGLAATELGLCCLLWLQPTVFCSLHSCKTRSWTRAKSIFDLESFGTGCYLLYCCRCKCFGLTALCFAQSHEWTSTSLICGRRRVAWPLKILLRKTLPESRRIHLKEMPCDLALAQLVSHRLVSHRCKHCCGCAIYCLIRLDCALGSCCGICFRMPEKSRSVVTGLKTS